MNSISSLPSTSPTASQIILKRHEEGSKVEVAAHIPEENPPVISGNTGEPPPQVESDPTLSVLENVWMEAGTSEENQQSQKVVDNPDGGAPDSFRKAENSVPADASLAVSHQKDLSKVVAPTSDEPQGSDDLDEMAPLLAVDIGKSKRTSAQISDGVLASLLVTCWTVISAVTVASFYLSHAAAWPMFGVTAALTLICVGLGVVKCREQKSPFQTINSNA